MNRTTPIAVAVIALAGTGTWWWSSRQQPPTPPPPAASQPAAPPVKPEPAAPAKAKVGQPPPQAAEEDTMLLPDGSRVATLNGVKNPPRLGWDDSPWSPIVAVERHGTLDWYHHADGSYSTTMMQWRSDLGRTEAQSICLHPRAAVPTAPLPDAPGGQGK